MVSWTHPDVMRQGLMLRCSVIQLPSSSHLPYDTDFSNYEGKDFTKDDQRRLAEALKKAKAKFILIIKNTDFIYSLYDGFFNILCFDKTYTYNVRSRNERNVEHLIITNISM